MTEERNQKVEQAIKEAAAIFIERESNKQALLTVTSVTLLDRGRRAVIYVSVLPESAESVALNFLKRKRAEIREILMKQLRIHPIPFVDVEIDKGERARQTISVLLRE